MLQATSFQSQDHLCPLVGKLLSCSFSAALPAVCGELHRVASTECKTMTGLPRVPLSRPRIAILKSNPQPSHVVNLARFLQSRLKKAV